MSLVHIIVVVESLGITDKFFKENMISETSVTNTRFLILKKCNVNLVTLIP